MALADPARELEAARTARQLEVGEHHVDLEAGLEDRHRLLGAAGLEDAIAAVPQIVGDHEPDQHLVVDHEHRRGGPVLNGRGQACRHVAATRVAARLFLGDFFAGRRRAALLLPQTGV